MSEEETWLPVVGFEGSYSVSDFGRVRSERRVIIRKNGSPCTINERIRRPARGQDIPYLSLALSRAGGTETRYVHDLVLTAFVGPRPAGLEACHGDGDATNNRAGNLRWDTRCSNHADKLAHGTATIGERHPMAKLTDSRIRSMRQRRDEGASFTTLAREFNVTRMTAYRAVSRKSWSHIE